MSVEVVVKKRDIFNIGTKRSVNPSHWNNPSASATAIELVEGPLTSLIKITVIQKYPRRTIRSKSWNGSIAIAYGCWGEGHIRLLLWGDQIDKVSSGDTVCIRNGWCAFVNGKPVISAGRSGQLGVLNNHSRLY